MSTNFGLNDSLKYNEFEFDSLSTSTAYDTDFLTTDWPLFLLGKPLNNIAALKVLEAQIPFSYYVFNSSNNKFILSESGGTPVIVAITPGNYTGSTITTELATQLNAATTVANTYTVTFAIPTQKITVSAQTGAARSFSFTFGSNVNDPGWTNPRLWLGYAGGINTSTTSVTPTLISPFVVQLTGPNYIFINSITLGAMVKLFLPANFGGNYGSGPLNSADGPQICKVPATAQPVGITFWQDPDPQKWFDIENWNSMAQVDLYLTMGDNPNPITLNGNSFSIKLGILTNENTHNDYLGGGRQNDRVQSRTWNTGSRF